MLTYTIVGYYTDNNQPFTTHVSAVNPAQAMRHGVEWALDVNGWDTTYADSVNIVAVLAGWCDLVTYNGAICRGDEIISVDSVICESVAI